MSLTNSQFESILRDYDRIRDENRRLLDARRATVYQTVAGYQELEDSVSALSVSAARASLAGDEDAPRRLHQSLAELALRRKALLADAGFPEDYLDPVYQCPHCRDTGYITDEENRKQKCSCFRRREISILYSQSNIQDIIAKENFSTLSKVYYQGEDLQRFEAAVNLSLEFVKSFDRDYRNLLLYGTVGTGKSFLSGCIARELIDSGHSVIYFSSSALFEALARYSFDHKEKDALQEMYEDIYGCDLLIVDDLGTEITNSFVASQLFSCLNERGLRNKSMIISTNLCLEELRDRYSDRIFSRITSSFSLCKLTGPDIRIYRKRFPNTVGKRPGTEVP
ncbi:MAG: ATP-binding protein [Roseburia sp.]|nr:ATP-binding protein [Roseburia sp.]MCM1099146.1 ATP-binding protein [Ruminococcus flavefaciens]